MQRYEKYSDIIITSQKKRRYATMYYPTPDRKSTDIYIITKKNDRMDLLADKYYGDPRKWVIIAKANRLHNGTIRVPVGIRLWIPYPYGVGQMDADFNNKQF